MSKAAFAKAIGLARQNVDKTVFDKTSLDTNLVCVISEVLECNLFNYFKCNPNDYNPTEVKAKLTIEIDNKSKDKIFHIIFGNNDVKI